MSWGAPARDQNVPMGWAYLTVSVNGAVYTLNVFRGAGANSVPVRVGVLRQLDHDRTGAVPPDLADRRHGVVRPQGCVQDHGGKVGLAITLASWAGLALSIRESFNARKEIREALRDLQGGEFAETPLPVKVERGVQFDRVAGKNLKLDVHRPAAPGSLRPALVQIHGGGWVLGFKAFQGHLLDEAHGPARLGVLQRGLPPEPGRHVARPPGRREAGHRVDPRARRCVRGRPGVHRRHRRVGGRAPHERWWPSPRTTPSTSRASKTPTRPSPLRPRSTACTT